MKDTPDDKSRKCLQDNKPNNTDDVGCPWFIASPEHHNCFWLYVKDKSQPDGSMPELVQSEIAKLMNWSNTKTHFMLKQAMALLVEALKKHNANKLLAGAKDEIIDLNSFNLNSPNYNNSEPEE